MLPESPANRVVSGTRPALAFQRKQHSFLQAILHFMALQQYQKPLDMRMRIRNLPLSFLVAILAGCSSGGGATTGMSAPRLTGEARERSAYVITEDEIAAQSFKNAWQAILSLRPAWPKVDAYVNSRRSSLPDLQNVPIETVREIRLLSREQARVRFGPEAQQAILVITRK